MPPPAAPERPPPPTLTNLCKMLAPQYLQHKQALRRLQQAVAAAGHADSSLRWIMMHPNKARAALSSGAEPSVDACANAVVLMFLSNKEWIGAALPGQRSSAYQQWLALAARPHQAAASASASAAPAATPTPGRDAAAAKPAASTPASAKNAPIPAPSAKPAAAAAVGAKAAPAPADEQQQEGGKWRQYKPPAPAKAQLGEEELRRLEEAVTLETVRPLVSPMTFRGYASKLRTLQRMAGGKTAAWLMQRPDEALAVARDRITQNVGTLMAYCTVVLSLFKHHEAAQAAWPEAWQEWQARAAELMERENKRVMESKMTDKQADNLVTWDEVSAKACELERAGAATAQDRMLHLEWLLFALLVRTAPKRADLGQLHVLREDPGAAGADRNYLLIKPGGMTLVINQHKTRDSHGALVEELTPDLAAIIRASLQLHPRAFLFVSSKTGDAFASNHLYGQWFQRVMAKHFDGRAPGCSFWRSIAERATLDWNGMSMEELDRRARLAGHSVETAQKRYRLVNIPARAAEDMAKPVDRCPAPQADAAKKK